MGQWIMENRKTPLYGKHLQAEARMVDFAGWMMPVQYSEGIIAEHLWVRKCAGIFDVSHMGRIKFRGQKAVGFLQYVLSSDVSSLMVGRSQYCIIPTETGGAVDDAYLYRFVEDEYLLVVNASNKEKDIEHFNKHIGQFSDVVMEDLSDELAMIALQGPQSEKILADLVGKEGLPAAGRNNLAVMDICREKVLVGRTGYTGEQICFELMIPCGIAAEVWDVLLSKGAKPIGLGARDTLRLEAGLPLYGHEFGVDIDGNEIPVFACPLAKFGVSFAPSKGDFIGKDELFRQKESLKRTIRKFVLTGKGIARDGAKVIHNDNEVGYVTSGTMVPYWKCVDGEFTDESSQRAIGLALIDSNIETGEKIFVDVRGRLIDGIIVGKNL